jgi:hypothetical protein
MMSQRSRKELVTAVQERYLKACKVGKKQILDEFVAATGYHRKYAIRILGHRPKIRGLKKPGRPKEYGPDVIRALATIWEICGCICSRRLKPFIPEMIEVLERCNELHVDEKTKAQLTRMSRATIDRCLRTVRTDHPHGLSTTKPGTLLKSQIPIQTHTKWDDEKPGFEEMDLVAHCGTTTEGQYLYTLTSTDIATGWTECLALPNKTQEAVSQAIQTLRQRLPFPLLGIDSDNGSEFINETLFRYCKAENISFTRSRPYQKNDQAHVEQKNWSVVRHTIGYNRLETTKQLEILASIHDDLRFYINFFQPVLKLVGKKVANEKTVKLYDVPITPFRRMLASNHISIGAKASLIYSYQQLNPVALRRSIDQKVDKLWNSFR